MTKIKNGREYKTIADAATELGVSVASIRRYIKDGSFPRPQRVFFGKQSYQVFSDEYLKEAKIKLANMRQST
jgi:DNA-binding transcriptional MerR regulator